VTSGGRDGDSKNLDGGGTLFMSNKTPILFMNTFDLIAKYNKNNKKHVHLGLITKMAKKEMETYFFSNFDETNVLRMRKKVFKKITESLKDVIHVTHRRMNVLHNDDNDVFTKFSCIVHLSKQEFVELRKVVTENNVSNDDDRFLIKANFTGNHILVTEHLDDVNYANKNKRLISLLKNTILSEKEMSSGKSLASVILEKIQSLMKSSVTPDAKKTYMSDEETKKIR
jgi:hypothetical protein